MRPVNEGKTWSFIQARRTAPCFASRRSMSRIPISSSRMETTDKYRFAAGSACAHARTLRSAFFPFLSSETTFVSRMYIRRNSSGKISRLVEIACQARRIEIDFSGVGHRQRVDNTFLATDDSLVFLGREQHVGWPPAIRNKNRPAPGRAL